MFFEGATQFPVQRSLVCACFLASRDEEAWVILQRQPWFMRDTRVWCSWWSFNFLTLVFGSLARRTPCVAWCSMYINLRAIQKLQHFFCKGTGKGTVGKSKSDDKSFGADGLGKEIRDHTYLVNCHVTSFQDGPFVSNPRVPTTFLLPLHSHRAYTLEGHTYNLRKWDKRTTTRTTP